ncbi:DMT family transporter [Neisseriaceae bacterium ESL0693]|nr:DMT family transporter [Neisseriaceae bacterium ESL0693]
MRSISQKSAAIGLVFGCLVFGLGSLIVKFVPIGSYAIALWRLLIGGLVFWYLSRHFGQRLPRNPKAWRFAVLSGIFLGFDLAFWHESIHAVGPGISTLLNSMQIFFLAAIAWFFFGERQSKLQLFSLLLAIIGVVLIASPELRHNGHGGYGIFIGLVSGAALAASMACIRQAHHAEPIALFPLMLLISIGGVTALIIPTLLIDHARFMPTQLSDVILILIYGVVMQCCAWALIAYAVPLLSLTLTGLLLLTEPIAALLIDYFLLHKPINQWQWYGVLVTLLAIYLGSLKSSAQTRKKTA